VDKKYSILFVSHEYPELNGNTGGGGIASVYYELSHGLANLGHDVWVLTRTYQNEETYMDGNVHVWRLPITSSPGKRTLKVAQRSKAVWYAILNLVESKHFDFIHFAEVNAEGYYYLKNRSESQYKQKLGKTKAIVRLHSSTKPYKKFSNTLTEKEEKILEMEKFTLENCDQVIAPCTATVEAVKKAMNLKNIPVFYDSNPINEKIFSPKAYCKPSSYFTFGYVGKISEPKGSDILIKAFSELASSYPNIRLQMVGREMYFKNTKTLFSSPFMKNLPTCIRERIEIIGNIARNELVQYYHNFDAFVFPSRYESVPNSVLEAMSCRLPIAASRVGGIPELLGDTKYNLLVKPNDVNELVEAMKKLLSGSIFCQQSSRYNRNRVEMLFSREVVSKNYLKLYKKLLEEGLV